jgi:hypothetical protein
VQTSFILAVASSRAQAGVGSGLRFGKSGMQAEGGRQRIQRMKILRSNMEKTRISPRFFSRSRASKGSQVDGLDVVDALSPSVRAAIPS